MGRHIVLGLLLLTATLFRLPPLLSANDINSDGAVVALQAKHLLEGEWSWSLWGVAYQSVVDPLVLAAGFLVTGANAYVLVATMLLAHLLTIAFAFWVANRRLGSSLAGLVTLGLVFTPMPINMLLGFGTRLWSVLLVVMAVWGFDRASEANESRYENGYFAGASCGLGLATCLDLFAFQMVPAVAGFAILCALDGRPDRGVVYRRVAWSAAGGICGLSPLFAAGWLNAGGSAQLGMSLGRVVGNARLLWETCLPWLLSTKVFVPGSLLYPELWQAPLWFQAIQMAGALLLCGAIGFPLWSWRRSDLSWPVRRLGLLGVAATGCAVASFLVSTKPNDMWAARYLGTILWLAPFTLAPAAQFLGTVRLGGVLAPYLLSVMVGGWLAYGPQVDGPWPALSPRAELQEEKALQAALRAHGIRYGAAQYWLAYRLTFLFDEDPILVPLDEGADRYTPYRRGFKNAKRVAYVFHPSEPRATVAEIEGHLVREGAHYSRHEVGQFVYLLRER